MKLSMTALLAAVGQVAWVFLKTGLVFFGGGFILIPVLHRELVQGLHWLTESEFLDGVAISQLTPGPVAVLSTFCGYRQAGVLGALVATAAVFLPAFVLMVLISKSYHSLSRIASVREVLNRLIPAIVGLLLATAYQIGHASVQSVFGIIVFIVALVLMIRWRINPAILIGASALLGWILRL